MGESEEAVSGDYGAFTAARLDEDEARALKAREAWDSESGIQELNGLSGEMFAYARAHGPARALREVTALRAVLSMSAPGGSDYGQGYADCLDDVKVHLAVIWDDHLDYGRLQP